MHRLIYALLVCCLVGSPVFAAEIKPEVVLPTPSPVVSETYPMTLPVGLAFDLPTGMRQIHTEAEAISGWRFQSSELQLKIGALPQNDLRTPRQLVMQAMNRWSSVSNKTLAEQGDLSSLPKVPGLFELSWMQGTADFAKQTWGYAFVGVVNTQTKQRFIVRFDWPISETKPEQSAQNLETIRRVLSSLRTEL